ncbi:DHA2 family efflux MFS transporter permease subunit [Candidatus Methylacidithermus pantelleriae]|uniref:EmrB/QacA family drug resistance transporter n=1 Tax=Candidatus Methylacidithermus pantelleriae TaxID=2744239 RepID=A0A8J2FUS2_9BACT|nr:DHA2 family efflux MFS transporter permease subunit [Candidatus Methylacidithermus pantelleriae]CAF0704486.1 EmrB/QacA family drug resistance transporter [Candidatus Methylacidithermus pantelleriae]
MSASSFDLRAQSWRPRHNPWAIALAAMLATFMEVLDTSVANVALPHIAGSLSAGTSESTWVLTSYLVSNAIVLPASGWFSLIFGRKRFFLSCIALFTLSSAVCGAAQNLPQLIFARVIQGLGGGALQPVSQAILLESFPPEKRGMAMGVFAMGVVVAPIVGPILGGWLTDTYSWRWIFYVNLPVGIAAVVLCQWLLEDPPYLRQEAEKGRQVDWIGFSLMAVGLGALQIVLDKGQEENWFDSAWITRLSWLSAVTLVCFVVRELLTPDPIVQLSVLRDRNFALGTLLVFLLGAVLYGSTAAVPLFLQSLLGYTAFLSGWALSPRGVGAFLASVGVGKALSRWSGRPIMAGAFLLLAGSLLALSEATLQTSMENIQWPVFVNGLAISGIFVPLTTLASTTLPRERINQSTGLFNLARNIGGSFGIALMTTFHDRWAQVHQAYLISHLTPENPFYRAQVELFQTLVRPQAPASGPEATALQLLYTTVLAQAELWSFVDIFRAMTGLSLFCLPLCFLFRESKRERSARGTLH